MNIYTFYNYFVVIIDWHLFLLFLAGINRRQYIVGTPTLRMETFISERSIGVNQRLSYTIIFFIIELLLCLSFCQHTAEDSWNPDIIWKRRLPRGLAQNSSNLFGYVLYINWHVTHSDNLMLFHHTTNIDVTTDITREQRREWTLVFIFFKKDFFYRLF